MVLEAKYASVKSSQSLTTDRIKVVEIFETDLLLLNYVGTRRQEKPIYKSSDETLCDFDDFF